MARLRPLSPLAEEKFEAHAHSSLFSASSASFSSRQLSAAEGDHATQAVLLPEGPFSSSRHNRRDSPAVTLTFAYAQDVASATNVSFASALCGNITSDVTNLIVRATASLYFDVPSCLAFFTNLTAINLNQMTISSWSSLPSSITDFSCTSCYLIPGSASSAGYNSTTGELDWNSLWGTGLNFHFTAMSFIQCSLSSLPSELSELVTYFQVSYNGRSMGTIPDTFYSRFSAVTTQIDFFSLILQNARLNGTIPANLFAPLAAVQLNIVQISISANSLSGSIPENLFVPFSVRPTALFSFTVFMTSNNLVGTIPAGLFPARLMGGGPASSFIVNLSYNKLTGSIPESLLGNLKSMSYVKFSLTNNSLIGPLPSQLMNSTWLGAQADLVLDFSKNLIDGTIPDTFLSSSFPTSYSATMSSISINLSGNILKGSVPENFFDASLSKRDFQSSLHDKAEKLSNIERRSSAVIGIVPTDSITIDFSQNTLSGSFPANFLANALSNSGSATLTLNSNGFTGQFPDLASTMPTGGATLIVNAALNSFSGDAPTGCYALSSVQYYISQNALNGSIPTDSLSSCLSLWLDVSQNPGFTATVPPQLFNITSLTFIANGTPLIGDVPANLTGSPSKIDLRSSDIDFCSHPWYVSVPNRLTCYLDYTTAACDCPAYYSGCSLVCTPPTVPSNAPSSTTSNPSPPSSPSSLATPGSISPADPLPHGCNIATRPSDEFVCVDGVWTAPFTSTPILTIPSGAGTVVVDGNVTSTSIVINGVGSNILIRGCAANLTMVTVTLTQEQLKQLGSSKTLQNLVTLSNASECDTNLNGLALDTQVSHGCRKVKTEKVVSSDGNTFGAYFTVNSGGCNTWWIILVSVICGVIVLGVVAAIVAGVLWKQHQEKKDFGRLSNAGSNQHNRG